MLHLVHQEEEEDQHNMMGSWRNIRIACLLIRGYGFRAYVPNYLSVLKSNHMCMLTPSSRSLSVVACKTMATSACPDQTVKVVTYEEMQDLIKRNSAIIIDVRQPDELLEGTIPSSFNVPLGEVEQALRDLTDEQFKTKYGHLKPQPSDRLVFSCRAGGRAHQATQTALLLGYCNSFNYKGSWTEWAERSKK